MPYLAYSYYMNKRVTQYFHNTQLPKNIYIQFLYILLTKYNFDELFFYEQIYYFLGVVCLKKKKKSYLSVSSYTYSLFLEEKKMH